MLLVEERRAKAGNGPSTLHPPFNAFAFFLSRSIFVQILIVSIFSK